jgi:hypothetical protein
LSPLALTRPVSINAEKQSVLPHILTKNWFA